MKVKPEQDEDDSGSVLFSESFSSQVMNNQKSNGEERKSSGRAASVPRPRAFLSSPDNDGMIGKRNRLKDGGPVLAPPRLQFHDVQKMPVRIKTNNCSSKKKNASESKIRKHKSPLVEKFDEDKNN